MFVFFNKIYHNLFNIDVSNKRVSWVDYGKCVCMLMVILSHTYVYYTKDTNLFLQLMQPTRLVVFFFISGYLIKLDSFDFNKMMHSIVKKLLFPYFVFTTIIWVPKHLGSELNLLDAIIDILGGYASWFVAALAVSKITLSLILRYTKSLKKIWLFCILFACVGLLIRQYISGKILWYAHNGLISMIYLAIGITYKKYESYFNKSLMFQLILSVSLYFTCVLLDHFIFKESVYIYRLPYGAISLKGVFTFWVLSVLGIWMTINLVKVLPLGIRWMSYIGRNSLTYYYLNTGVLTVFIVVCSKIGLEYNGNDYFTIGLYILTVLTLTLISKLILRYAPWMLGDFRQFGKKK